MSCTAPGQADPHDQPASGPEQVAELDRQDRTDQRPCPRDRGEVVAEQNPTYSSGWKFCPSYELDGPE